MITENFPNLGKKTDIQIRKSQRVPKRNPKRGTLRHIITKVPKLKIRKDS